LTFSSGTKYNGIKKKSTQLCSGAVVQLVEQGTNGPNLEGSEGVKMAKISAQIWSFVLETTFATFVANVVLFLTKLKYPRSQSANLCFSWA